MRRAPFLLALGLAACSTAPPAAVLPYLSTDRYERRVIEGWTVFVNPEILADQPEVGQKALRILELQLFGAARVLPAVACARLRQVPIWLDVGGPDGRGEYHPNPEWVRTHGRNPDKAKCVEISNAARFITSTLRQPAFLIHELSHAYHDQVLGFDNPEIRAAYQEAKASGGYDAVLGPGGKRQRAYALENPQEYFAEASEAFFGTNDFFPFVRHELREHDPRLFEILDRVWGR